MATDFAQCIFLSQEGYDVIRSPFAACCYEAKGIINSVLSESFCTGATENLRVHNTTREVLWYFMWTHRKAVLLRKLLFF